MSEISVTVNLPPTKRSTLQSVALGAALGKMAHEMATKNPEWEQWFIVTNNQDGTFDIRDLTGALFKSRVPCIDAAGVKYLKAGMSVLVGYFNRDKQRPYIKGLSGASGSIADKIPSGNGLWLTPEGFQRVAYGLDSVCPPLWFADRTTTVLLDLARGVTEADLAFGDPRGLTITTPTNSAGLPWAALAAYYPERTGVYGHIKEVAIEGTDLGSALDDTLTFPATEAFPPTTQADSAERRQGYLFADPASGIYTVCVDSGIYAVNRSQPGSGNWSSWANSTEEDDGAGGNRFRINHSGNISCAGPYLIECSYSEFNSLAGDSATSHAAIQLYTRDNEFLFLYPIALVSLASLVPRCKRIFGCGAQDKMTGDVGPAPNLQSTRWPFIQIKTGNKVRNEWWAWLCAIGDGDAARGYFKIFRMDAATQVASVVKSYGPPPQVFTAAYGGLEASENARLSSSYPPIAPPILSPDTGTPTGLSGPFERRIGDYGIKAPDGSTYFTPTQGTQNFYGPNGGFYGGELSSADDPAKSFFKDMEYFSYPYLADWDNGTMPSATNYNPKYPQRVPSGVLDSVGNHYTIKAEPGRLVVGLTATDPPEVSTTAQGGGTVNFGFAYLVSTTWFQQLQPGAPPDTWWGPRPHAGTDYIIYTCEYLPGTPGFSEVGDTSSVDDTFGHNTQTATIIAKEETPDYYFWYVYSNKFRGQRLTIPIWRQALICNDNAGKGYEVDITQYCSWSPDGTTDIPRADNYPYNGSVWQLAASGDFLWILRQRPWTLTDNGKLPGGSADLQKREPYLELRQKKDGKLLKRMSIHPPSDLPGRALVCDYSHPPHFYCGLDYDAKNKKVIPWATVFCQWKTSDIHAAPRHSRTLAQWKKSALERKDDISVGKPVGMPSTLEARTLALQVDSAGKLNTCWIDDGSSLVKYS